MKKTIFAVVAAVSALGAVSAQAADGVPYAGVGVVASEHRFDIDQPGSGIAVGDKKSTEWGGKVFAGYQFTPMWAIEGGYTNFGKGDVDYRLSGVNGTLESKSESFYLAGKATYPVAEKVNVFGKLGVAHNRNDVTGSMLGLSSKDEYSKNSVYAALGTEYAINEKVSLSLEYEHYGKSGNDLGRRKGGVSLGARYSF
ncbi:outer membrane beta-barrel protein [Pseudoduganella plicata]|uniref:Membrane protein n=1 Tax=Pseudoduganella plicata TaxID=321984 RepID=A0A4P7BGK7_9BURK|nr:outer membrane beta-barrel protein [Pseudoduganella plicata]QBQ37420.1 porin family protein [Pseudoduganella plicata]GGY90057.1 membrane protein [Pseudoduganella plicata]